MPSVKFTRSNEFVNKLRNYCIYLNGKEMLRLANQETKEVTLEPGDYRIKAKIDWCSSKELQIRVSEHEVIQIG